MCLISDLLVIIYKCAVVFVGGYLCLLQMAYYFLSQYVIVYFWSRWVNFFGHWFLCYHLVWIIFYWLNDLRKSSFGGWWCHFYGDVIIYNNFYLRLLHWNHKLFVILLLFIHVLHFDIWGVFFRLISPGGVNITRLYEIYLLI